MLNLHSPIINNNLNNTIYEELSTEWLNRISPEARGGIITGYYNAGILTINLSDFNNGAFYDTVIKKSYEEYCKKLFDELMPIIQKCLRRMFQGFNAYLINYDIVLFMEGRDGDGLEPVKYSIKII